MNNSTIELPPTTVEGSDPALVRAAVNLPSVDEEVERIRTSNAHKANLAKAELSFNEALMISEIIRRG